MLNSTPFDDSLRHLARPSMHLRAPTRGCRLALALLLCLTARPSAQSPVWQQVHEGPGGRFDCAGATDTARGRFVVWGGDRSTVTHEFDGQVWLEIATAHAPSPRNGVAMAYHAQRRVVVAFGGRDFAGARLGDTWLYDGQDWQQVGGPGPSVRVGHAMAYDPLRGKIVLFSGEGAAADTWEWDGGWTQQTPAQAPPARHGHMMAFDARAGRVLLTGSRVFGVADTWHYDGTNWQLVGSAPMLASAALTPHGADLLLTGGYSHVSGGPSALSYLWTGGAWQAAPSAPAAFSGAAHGTDPATGTALIHGGFAPTSERLSDTVRRTATGWQTASSRELRGTDRLVGAYDTARQLVVACGRGRGFLFTTWELHGERWSATTGGPQMRLDHAVAYDDARRQLILFGGVGGSELDDTWSYAAGAWTPLNPATRPSARSAAAMAYDAARARVVLFGGGSYVFFGGIWFLQLAPETWTFDGTNWTQASPTVLPPPRMNHAMAYDAARRVVVLFGGRQASLRGDTWEWDGRNWAQRATVGPAPRERTAMGYDAQLGRIVLHGGLTDAGWVDDGLWAWDGTAWSSVAVTGSPGVVSPTLLVHDPVRRASVIVDGFSGNTWMLLADADRATSSSYGQGCFAAPRLGATVPYLGAATLRLDMTSGPPSASTAVGLSLNRGALPLPGGCTLLIDPNATAIVLTTSSSPTGFASVALSVPDDPSLVGALLRAQAFAADPSSTFAGLSLSNGLELRLGR